MMKRVPYAVVIDVGGHIIGSFLDAGHSIAHSDADMGVHQHFQIVAAVTEGHDLVRTDTEMGDHLVHADRLAAIGRDEVGKQRSPTGRFAARNMPQKFLFFRFRDEGAELIDLVVQCALYIVLRTEDFLATQKGNEFFGFFVE